MCVKLLITLPESHPALYCSHRFLTIVIKKKSHLMRRDFFILIQSLILADDVHLGDEVLSVGVFVDNEEHIASIEADAALQVLLKIDIT